MEKFKASGFEKGNNFKETQKFILEKKTEDCHHNSVKSEFLLSNSDYEKAADTEDGGAEEGQKVQVTKGKSRTGWLRYLGILCGLCSCLCFSLSILIVKYISPSINPASAFFYRSAGILLSFPILLYFRFVKKVNVLQSVWPLTSEYPKNLKTATALFFRGVLGAASILLQFYALTYISMASVTTINFSTPIFVGFLAWLFLGEKCGVVPVLAALISFLGVVVTAKIIPGLGGSQEFSLEDGNIIGCSIALCAMLVTTSYLIVLRYLREVHFLLVGTAFGFISIFVSALLSTLTGRFDLPKTPWLWVLVILLGILTCLGQFFMTAAMKFEDAGPIALVRTSDVIFAFIWQFIFLGVAPDVYSGAGAVIVCIGVGLTAFRKYVTTLPPNHKNRKRWGFMLK